MFYILRSFLIISPLKHNENATLPTQQLCTLLRWIDLLLPGCLLMWKAQGQITKWVNRNLNNKDVEKRCIVSGTPRISATNQKDWICIDPRSHLYIRASLCLQSSLCTKLWFIATWDIGCEHTWYLCSRLNFVVLDEGFQMFHTMWRYVENWQRNWMSKSGLVKWLHELQASLTIPSWPMSALNDIFQKLSSRRLRYC